MDKVTYFKLTITYLLTHTLKHYLIILINVLGVNDDRVPRGSSNERGREHILLLNACVVCHTVCMVVTEMYIVHYYYILTLTENVLMS